MASKGKTIRDIMERHLQVLFCGINPGLYSAATGHHFARPGNRFWPTLYRAGFTDRQLTPVEERALLDFHCGITNLVSRSTVSAAELTVAELSDGRRRLMAKVRRYAPRYLAVLGIDAYRRAFARPRAILGKQPELVGDTVVWVLPNPSGLNAHYQPTDLARLFRRLRDEMPPR
jgi:TDG/mug DNA glycosylase family protein